MPEVSEKSGRPESNATDMIDDFDHTCEFPGCTKKLTFAVFKYSISVYKQALCVLHQRRARADELKPQIKFSHRYTKMPEHVEYLETFVVSATKVRYGSLTQQQIDQDTAIVGGGYYTLPQVDLLHIVLWSDTIGGGKTWGTYRPWNPEKEAYYRTLCGKSVRIVIDKS